MPDSQTASELYRTMLKIRLAELKIAEIYPSDKIQSPVHLSIGQEAVSCGVLEALSSGDHIYGTYRGHGLYIASGAELKFLFAELYAKATGCAGGRGGSMHLVAPETGLMGCSAIVASTIPLAVGDALSAQMQGSSRVAVAVFGDGAVDEGVFFESLNFAALKKLPVVFVCENNNYAVHSKVSDRHAQTELYKYGEALGVPGKRFDGLDVNTVYTTMMETIEAVRRKGYGPKLVEYTNYRWHEHVGPGKDHAEAYRDRSKLDYALTHDSLELQAAYLRKEHGITDATLNQWEGQIRREIEEAVQFAESSPFPEATSLYEDVFLEKP